MKTNYDINININDLHKNESLLQSLQNISKLEFVSYDVLNKINKAIIEKKSRLENLKARIIRISQIVQQLDTIPQAFVFKSSRSYPSNVSETYLHKSIYYDNICDFSLLKQTFQFKDNPAKLLVNINPSNLTSNLGKKPDGNMEDVCLNQEILNTLVKFSTVKSNLKLTNSSGLFSSNEIDKYVEMCTSIFQFMGKTKVYGEKLQRQLETISRESMLMSNFLNHKEQKKKKQKVKIPENAPVTIKDAVPNYKQKREVIKRNTKTTTNTDIWNNKIKKDIDLKGIIDMDVQTGPLEEYFDDEIIDNIDNYAPEDKIFNDDINEFSTPMEHMINFKKNKNSNNNKTNNEKTDSNNNNPPVSNNNSNNPPVSNDTNNNNNNVTITSTNVNTMPKNDIVVNTTKPDPPKIENIPKAPDSKIIPPATKIPDVPKLPASAKIPKVPTAKPKSDKPNSKEEKV